MWQCNVYTQIADDDYDDGDAIVEIIDYSYLYIRLLKIKRITNCRFFFLLFSFVCCFVIGDGSDWFGILN